jgi:hypothetical protein
MEMIGTITAAVPGELFLLDKKAVRTLASLTSRLIALRFVRYAVIHEKDNRLLCGECPAGRRRRWLAV